MKHLTDSAVMRICATLVLLTLASLSYAACQVPQRMPTFSRSKWGPAAPITFNSTLPQIPPRWTYVRAD